MSCFLTTESKDYVDGGFHLHWLVVKLKGPVTGLRNGIDSGLLQHGWTTYHAQVLDGSVFRYHGLNDYGPLNPCSSGDSRVYGLNRREQLPGGHARLNVDGTLWRSWFYDR